VDAREILGLLAEGRVERAFVERDAYVDRFALADDVKSREFVRQ
jgi:hypothetical protein